MSNERSSIRFVCSDLWYDFKSEIDFYPKDIIVPVPGVFLGGAGKLIKRSISIPKFQDSLIVFMTHNPCVEMPDAKKAYRNGCYYADRLNRRGVKAISIFLREESVNLYDPSENKSDLLVQGLFTDAIYAQRHCNNKKPRVNLKEVAIAPYFDLKDFQEGVLYISSNFFTLTGLCAIKNFIGTFPQRNYDKRISDVTKNLFEAAFSVA